MPKKKTKRRRLFLVNDVREGHYTVVSIPEGDVPEFEWAPPRRWEEIPVRERTRATDMYGFIVNDPATSRELVVTPEDVSDEDYEKPFNWKLVHPPLYTVCRSALKSHRPDIFPLPPGNYVEIDFL